MKRTCTKRPVLAATAERSEGYTILGGNNMKKIVYGATVEHSSGYDEAKEVVSNNFDYAMEGFEKIARDSKEGDRASTQMMLELNSAIESIVQKIANIIQE